MQIQNNQTFITRTGPKMHFVNLRLSDSGAALKTRDKGENAEFIKENLGGCNNSGHSKSGTDLHRFLEER